MEPGASSGTEAGAVPIAPPVVAPMKTVAPRWAGARRTVGRLTAAAATWARAHPRALLVLAATLPFLPGALQFIERGIPDVLFTGDAATLELRTLHAEHGAQWVGAYSRFQWNHPGPAFFYLALPIYEVFGRRGPALNLFAFLVNLVCVVGFSLNARRLRGTAFALAATTLMTVYACVGAPFQLASEWNPVIPILPLGLLSLLCARLTLGAVEALPWFVFVSSAVVQTHVGYLPVVGFLCGMAFVGNAARWLLKWRRAMVSTARAADKIARRPRRGGSAWALAAAGIAVLLWLPPIIENATHHPGNLQRLYEFFTAGAAEQNDWNNVLDPVGRQLAIMPLAALQAFGFLRQPPLPLILGVAGLQALGVLVAVAVGLRRRDRVATTLGAVALVEIVAALAAVRAIRGGIQPYLVVWISVVGVVSSVAVLAAFIPARKRRERSSVASMASMTLAAAVVVTLAFSVRSQAERVDVFRGRDENVERLANDVERYLVSAHGDVPTIRIGPGGNWWTLAAVVLSLHRHDVPVFVDRRWLFMMGEEFAAPSSRRPWLSIGDRASCDPARARRDARVVALTANACAVIEDPDYLKKHRITAKGLVLSTRGVRGDPARVVDGVIPDDGTPWDSPLATVLESTESFIDVAVPAEDVVGVFLTVDGQDTYSVECDRAAGQWTRIGAVWPAVPVGLGTGIVFYDDLGACRAVRVRPERGDGLYSVGEIGFLKRETQTGRP